MLNNLVSVDLSTGGEKVGRMKGELGVRRRQ